MDVAITHNDNHDNLSGETPPEDSAKDQKRLLFVDDDPGILDGYKFIFENEGFDVDIALDSKTMMKLLKGKKYDMIILDYYLQEEKGTETALRILQVDPKIELVFISGESFAWEELKAKNIPVTAFFVKPLRAEALLDYVSELLLGIE